MALSAAHQGYFYQDILSAYFVAEALASGKDTSEFYFDQKKTPQGVPDKFDDITIVEQGVFNNFQVKYSNKDSDHVFTKSDISTGDYDLALNDLFISWKSLSSVPSTFRLCLAWKTPDVADAINKVLLPHPTAESRIAGTTCYQVSIDTLWSEENGVLPSWKKLKTASGAIDRNEFKIFLQELVIEVGYPKSSELESQSSALEKLLYATVARIGIGTYPNDHLNVDDVVHKLCSLTRYYRSNNQSEPISVQNIAVKAGIRLDNGAIEQDFPVDHAMLVTTPERVQAVTQALTNHSLVVLTGEPGAGKSWFIANLIDYYRETNEDYVILQHYCYTNLGDDLQTQRVTVNAMYGSLIDQLVSSDEDLGVYKTMRWGSNLNELNLLLGEIKKPTLLIVDGIDHIWRVYQRNKGGLTEDETAILQALSLLNVQNPNISVLVVSQPIEQLNTLSSFQVVALPEISESFTELILEKHGILNKVFEDKTLSEAIYHKSQGNALYNKYLVQEAERHQTKSTLDWLDTLPEYSYNLAEYYDYLYSQIEEGKSVPYAFCGAAFALSIQDLKDITGGGHTVDIQLATLRPVLNYTVAYGGYKIYHESFKRFIVEKLEHQKVNKSIAFYRPLIMWLESKSFFEYKKAYAHLLKLYYEVERYEKIGTYIHEEFITKSLVHLQPFATIVTNFRLLAKSLLFDSTFKKQVIISELASVVSKVEFEEDSASYILAVKALKGRKAMYDLLSYQDEQLATQSEIEAILIEEAYDQETDIAWSLVKDSKTITEDRWRFAIVKALSTQDYKNLNHYFSSTVDDPEYDSFHTKLLNEFEQWIYKIDDSWVDHVPPYFEYLESRIQVAIDPVEVVKDIKSNDRWRFDSDWKHNLFQLRLGVRQCVERGDSIRIQQSIDEISSINWFYNWVIFMIKTTALAEQSTCTAQEIEEAFSFLIRDLNPFKGDPRASDLYTQVPFIRTTFRRGLDLCPDPKSTMSCIHILERVTEITTSIQNSHSGPLTVQAYLDITQDYLTPQQVKEEYEQYYDALSSKRVYSDLLKLAFKYSAVLAKAGDLPQAQQKFEQGVQFLTAYGYRKDRTLSEILDPLVPYQNQYGTLSPEYFYDVYGLTMTVTSHTDRKGTQYYPIEWFDEFVQVHPIQALQFLISQTLQSPVANFHQERQCYNLLKDHSDLLDATSWFFLMRTFPIACSEKVLTLALDKMSAVNPLIRNAYRNWAGTLPELSGTERYNDGYTQTTIDRYVAEFGDSVTEHFKLKEMYSGISEPETVTPPPFPTGNIDEVLAYIETQPYTNTQSGRIKQLLNSVEGEDRKQLLRSLASRNISRSSKKQDGWLEEIVIPGSDDWIYLMVSMFVYFVDDRYSGLSEIDYLQQAYTIDPARTLNALNEILAIYIAERSGHIRISSNLITALATIGVEESVVKPLLQLTNKIISHRLPDTYKPEIATQTYTNLEGFSKEELVVSLLIARLKTLSTIKTQSSIYALTFIAQTEPQNLLKPLQWVFNNSEHLLPIHRAFLLQLMLETYEPDELPEALLGVLVATYPTGYFMEDRIIYDLLNAKLKKPEAPINLEYPATQMDEGLLSHFHPKYEVLDQINVSMRGVTEAFRRKKKQIHDEIGDHYYDRAYQLTTCTVSYGNAMYEIANTKFYDELWEMSDWHRLQYFTAFNFLLVETALLVGSHAPRPLLVPSLTELPNGFSATQVKHPDSSQKWVTLASFEEIVVGETFAEKDFFSTLTAHYVGTQPTSNTFLYSLTPFTQRGYATTNATKHDQPISFLQVEDSFEKITIVFLSPFILNALSLQITDTPTNGLYAVNPEGEKVVVFTSWKEQYTGDISNGNEFPLLSGCSVQVRSDYFQKILNVYDNPVWYATQKTKRPF